MSDLINAAINALTGGQPQPIDWELKRRADEQRVRREEADFKRRLNGAMR